MCFVHLPQGRSSRPKRSTDCWTRSAQRNRIWPENWHPRNGDKAMAKTTWGRKETIIWPYYRPLYTYGTVFLGLVLTGVFLCCRFSFSHEPLQRFYAPLYVRTMLIGSFRSQHRDTYRMLFIA